ncbi:MAG TPA: helix-turn-helix transcriptional regulator [Planctomycetota bacterium]|nr:helix-turn-helix transcriptional regulator [Planctomycetota bacterium]
MSDIGKQILYKRKALGWNRKQVAEYLGVAADVTVARYESGKTLPQRKYMQKVHEFLRLPSPSASGQHAAITSSGQRRAIGSKANLPAVIVSQDLEQKIKVLSNKDKALVAALVDRLMQNL